MKPLTIIINDIALDMFEDTEFYVTEQIHDLTDLSTRNASFARTLSVPITPTNQRALQDSGNVFPNQRNVVTRVPAKILFRGVPYVNNALASYAIDDGAYNLEFSFRNYDFFETLQGQPISELEWSDLNFNMDLAGWQSKVSETKDLVTALTQYYSSDNLYNVDLSLLTDFRINLNLDFAGFHLYLKSIAQRIVEQHGFTYDDSQMVGFGLYDTLALSCPVDKFLFDYALANPINAFVSSNVNQSETAAGDSIEERIDFLVTTGDPGGLWSTGTMQWNIPSTGSINILLTLTVDHQPGGGAQDTQIRIYKNTSIIATDYSLNALGAGVHDLSLSVNTDVVSGDIIYATIYISRQSTSIIQSGAVFTIEDQRSPATRSINVEDYVPNIPQKSFLVSFANLFNAVIDTDELSKTVFLTPFDNILAASPQDITDNRDASRPVEKQYFLPYFQESIFKYSDNDIRRTDINATFAFSGELLEKRGVLVEVAFEASDNSVFDQSLYFTRPCMEHPAFTIEKSVVNGLTHGAGGNAFSFANAEDFKVGDYLESHNFTGGNREVKRIITKTTDLAGTVVDNWVNAGAGVDATIYRFTQNETESARISNIENNQNYGIFFGSDLNSAVGILGFVAEFTTEMTWGSLLQDYAPLLDRLTEPFVLRAWFRFTPAEFSNLDQDTPVYLKDFASTFWLNKAEQYNPKTQLCRLELIRI